MRPQVGGVVVTVPPRTSQATVTDTLNRFRQRLRSRQLEMQKGEDTEVARGACIGWDFHLESDLMSIALERGTRSTFHLRAEPGRTTIVCSPDTDFADPERQKWMHRVVERALRQQAQWLLPERLHALSALHHLPFGLCKVNTSKGRWGSCSARGHINLSCYLILLPPHLREYVMLHELCHTREMNHGPHFWALLDGLTGGRARELRKELREWHTTF